MNRNDRRPGDLRRRIGRLGLRLLAVVLLAALLLAVDLFVYRDRLYPGLVAGVTRLGGLTRSAAVAELEAANRRLGRTPLVLIMPDGEALAFQVGQLGATLAISEMIDEAYAVGRRGWPVHRYRERFKAARSEYRIDLSWKINEDRLNRELALVERMIWKHPRDASFTLQEETLLIEEEEYGRRLDWRAAKERIYDIFRNWPPAGRLQIAVPAVEIAPAQTAAGIRAMGIDRIMASYSTHFNARDEGRAHNIRLAAAAIHGVLLAPGETFAFLETVGEISHDTGYRDAPVISNNRIVQGVGGGVCQVSSTVYNAALQGNLEIVERYNHSLRVAYLPAGRDATVASGVLDLKFKNNRDHHILIGSVVQGGTLTINLFGLEMPEEVIIEQEVLDVFPPPVEYIKDERYPQGYLHKEQEGISGQLVRVWRAVYQNGELVERRLLSTDRYQTLPAIVRVGTGESTGGTVSDDR